MNLPRRRLIWGSEATRQVAQFVRDLAHCARMSSHRAYLLRLAADEITTNIINHGYCGRSGVLELVGGLDSAGVWLRIEDEAPPFDPRDHDPTHRLAEDPQQREAGGLGLYLALNSVDDFSYDYVGGRNHNTLIMREPVIDQVRNTEDGERHDRDNGSCRRQQ